MGATQPANKSYRGRLPVVFAALLIGLAVLLYGVGSDLVTFFIPLRTVVLTCLLLGLGLLGLRIARRKRAAPSLFVYALVGVAIVLAGVVYVREFTAYREGALSFENAEAVLAGTLYLPKAPGRYPTVVIAQGSLKAPRRLYHLWADRLVRSGVAVYSFDKRGTGASGGDYEAENNSSTENLSLLASDVAAAVRAVRAHPEVDRDQVGLLGISMGGWLAPLAAAETESVRFIVVVCGPPVSVGEERYYSDLTGEIHGEGAGFTQAVVDSLVAVRAPSGFDPRLLLRASDVPILWLFGGQDSSVPTAKSVAVLDSLIERDARPFRYVVFPEAEHLGFVMRWPFDLAPGYWDEITHWITTPEMRQRTGLAE